MPDWLLQVDWFDAVILLWTWNVAWRQLSDEVDHSSRFDRPVDPPGLCDPRVWPRPPALDDGQPAPQAG